MMLLAAAPRSRTVRLQISDKLPAKWRNPVAADIPSIVKSILKEEFPNMTPPAQPQVDDLVKQVRTRCHDRIQSLHGTMPLWGIDRWLPVGDLLVDVNILESDRSSRRSELDDLWQDSTTNNSDDRSFNRIGLGQKRELVSGLTVLERNTNLLVVGKPGSGKTTYLQSIVTECNHGKLQPQRIPVLIKLREFIDDGRECHFTHKMAVYARLCFTSLSTS